MDRLRAAALLLTVAALSGGCGTSVQSPPVTLATQAKPGSDISEARAAVLARDHSSLKTFVSVTAGPFADVNTDVHVGPGYPIKAADMVWAVRFMGEETICNPLGSCSSPRPGITIVFLDYVTGDFRTAAGFSEP
jgi:hypothetical protein